MQQTLITLHILIKDLEKRLKCVDSEFDIKNQARGHIWYNEKYGTDRKQYTCVEDAIACWGATVTCVGVRLEDGKLVVHCPYGLNDIFSMTIRPVKKDFEKEHFYKKADRWKEKWKKVTIIKW